MFTLRRGFKEDVQDFVNLFLLLAHYFPEVFGKNIVYVLEKLFLRRRNHFSYEHAVFVEFNGGRVGMLLDMVGRGLGLEEVAEFLIPLGKGVCVNFSKMAKFL
jgi:hypothetical protein